MHGNITVFCCLRFLVFFYFIFVVIMLKKYTQGPGIITEYYYIRRFWARTNGQNVPAVFEVFKRVWQLSSRIKIE